MADFPTVQALSTGDPRWRVYVYSIIDVPGVVASNNFLSFYNPPTSGKIMLAVQGIVTSYALAAVLAGGSMATYNISAASGGTLVAASAVPKLFTPWPNSSVEVRHSNPSVTTTTSALAVFPPVISTGAGGNAAGNITTPSPNGVPYLPGEGFVWNTASGDIDQRWNITFIWAEVALDSVETV